MRLKIETLKIETLALQPHAGERTDSTALSGGPRGQWFNRPMAQWPNPQRGFTLLEVMIAMAIMVLAIATIIPLFAVGSASHKKAIDQSHVAWIAPRIAARLQADLYDASPEDITGETWKEYESYYTYDATFKPLTSDQSDGTSGAAFLLQVFVRWNEGGVPHVEEYKTVVLRKTRR